MKKLYLIIPVLILIPVSAYAFTSSNINLNCEQTNSSGVMAVCERLGLMIDNQEVIKQQNSVLILEQAQTSKLVAIQICTNMEFAQKGEDVQGNMVPSFTGGFDNCVKQMLELSK